MEYSQGTVEEVKSGLISPQGKNQFLDIIKQKKSKETKYDKKRLTLGRIISSPHKTSIIETLHDKDDLQATEIYKQSGTSSEGTFFYHLRDLGWLGVIEQHDKSYALTEFGKEIAISLSKLP